jgi:cysteine-rich repeat protein/VCBS repeat-containing protein
MFDTDDAAYEDLDTGDVSTINVTYSVTDPTNDVGNGAFDIVVTGTNDAPVATFIAAQAVNEDAAAITDTLTATDADADDVLTFTLDAVTAGLTLAGAVWTFDPSDAAYQSLAIGETQVITVNYTVTDSQNAIGQASFDITVTGTNDAPVATTLSFSTDEDVTLNVDVASGVLSNDTDADTTDTLTAVLVTGPTDGVLVLNPDGSFDYTPNADFNGADSFVYHADDTNDPSADITINITVNSVNDAPIAVDDAHTLNEDETLNVIAGVGLLANDTDTENDLLTAILVNDVATGTLTFNADGSFDYTPNLNFNGTDSFTYKVNDGDDSNIATVTLTITAVNDTPLGGDDTYTVAEDEVLDRSGGAGAEGVLDNDQDVEGDNLTATLVGGVTNGALGFNADGTFTYTPSAEYNGPDSFTYTVTDDGVPAETSALITVNITVSAVNDAPVAQDDPTFTVDEDLTLNEPAITGLLVNDTDVDNVTVDLTASLVDDTNANGTVVVNADGSFDYSPDANFNGVATFTYQVVDNGTPAETSNIATATITVNAVNDVPIGTDDAHNVAEDGTLNVDIASGVLANDTDVEGDNLTVAVDTNVSNGVLTLNADGSFDYTPDADFNGVDTFTYLITDDGTPAETSVAVTVTITIDPVNDAPVAVDDPAYTVVEDNILTADGVAANPLGVLDNDSDIDGDNLTVSLNSDVSNGILVLNGVGTFTYTPNADFEGVDSFTYLANDGNADSGITTVTITVTGVNDAPVTVDDTGSVDEDLALNVVAPGVLANDTDAETDAFTAVLVDDVSNGSLTLNADGSYDYTPNADFNGQDSFTYLANDGQDSNIATVVITVNAINDAPIAVADTYNATEDENLIIDAASGVLANDTDVDHTTAELSVLVTSNPASGNLALNGDGSFTYSPDANFVGTINFDYEVSDGALTSTVTAEIVVANVNDAPTLIAPTPAEGDTLNAPEGQLLTFTVTGDDVDITCCGDTLIYSMVTDLPGTATLNAGTGVFEWTPTYDEAGTYSAMLMVTDALGDMASVNVTIVSVFDDVDADTLPDTWETDNGLDPTTNDSDGDNILDQFEVGGDINAALDTDGLAPIDALDNDSDEDGIPDLIEAGDADPLTDPIDTDSDGTPDYRDTDSDNDTLTDGVEDANGDGIVDPTETSPRLADTDADGFDDPDDNCPIIANADQADLNGDTIGDVCGDIDLDGVSDDVDNCVNVGNPGQEDFDGADGGDACDDDDDNDGVLDVDDSDDNDPTVCLDNDGDTCDDCSSGTVDPANDGFDFDQDGECDAGDADDDNDGSLDADDSDDNDSTVCSDTDNDLCDDCFNGSFNIADDGLDTDADGICDIGDLCVDVPDPAQIDTDNDGEGDECDCGDNVVAGIEECDSGAVDSANCDFDFTFVSCGDSHTNAAAGETCDDGNQDNTDACVELNGVCTNSSCGDGFIQDGVEICDDGNQDNTDDCPDGIGGTCEASYCGDGFVHALNETCDDANDVNDDACTNVCELPACGDGILQGIEVCDDGNLLGGDGCDGSCNPSDDVLWLTIPAGNYNRGNQTDRNARPVKNVAIGEFMIMRAEVTVKQYRECVDAGECSMPGTGSYCNYLVAGRDWHPINCVSQVQAKEYAAYLDALDPAMHIRLPSEAEWEYAARSLGVEDVHPWGDEVASCDFANLREGGYGCGTASTAHVCSTSTTNTPRAIPVPNGDTVQGVCDMAGNISEWTLDVFSSDYSNSFADARPFPGFTNLEDLPRIPTLRIVRGGSWVVPASFITVTKRNRASYSSRSAGEGIRLVSSLCGNGVIEGTEVCDDGNSDSFDGCNFLCQESDL